MDLFLLPPVWQEVDSKKVGLVVGRMLIVQNDGSSQYFNFTNSKMEARTSMTKDEFQKERTRIISEMLDNPDEHGIFPTGRCFQELDKLYDLLASNRLPFSKIACPHCEDLRGVAGDVETWQYCPWCGKQLRKTTDRATKGSQHV